MKLKNILFCFYAFIFTSLALATTISCSSRLRLKQTIDRDILKLNNLIVNNFSITHPNVNYLHDQIIKNANDKLNNNYHIEILNKEIFAEDKTTVLTDFYVKNWTEMNKTYDIFVKYKIIDSTESRTSSLMSIKVKTASSEENNKLADKDYLINDIDFIDKNNKFYVKVDEFINNNTIITKKDFYQYYFINENSKIENAILNSLNISKRRNIKIDVTSINDISLSKSLDNNEEIDMKEINDISITSTTKFYLQFTLSLNSTNVSKKAQIAFTNAKSEIKEKRANEIVKELSLENNSIINTILFFKELSLTKKISDEQHEELTKLLKLKLSSHFQQDNLIKFEFYYNGFRPTSQVENILLNHIIVKYDDVYATNSKLLNNKFYFKVQADKSQLELAIDKFINDINNIKDRNIGLIEFHDDTKVTNINEHSQAKNKLTSEIKSKINKDYINSPNITFIYKHKPLTPQKNIQQVEIEVVNIIYHGVDIDLSRINKDNLIFILSYRTYQKSNLEHAKYIADILSERMKYEDYICRLEYPNNQEVSINNDLVFKLKNELFKWIQNEYSNDNVDFEISIDKFTPAIYDTKSRVYLKKLLIKYKDTSHELDLVKSPLYFVAVVAPDFLQSYNFLVDIANLYKNINLLNVSHNGYEDINTSFKKNVIETLIKTQMPYQKYFNIDNFEILNFEKEEVNYWTNLPKYKDISKDGEIFVVRIKLSKDEATYIFEINITLSGVK